MPSAAERRRSQRFALPLTLRLRTIEPLPYVDQIISGECLNISSSGLLFTAAEVFSPGQVIEAFVDWPVLLDNRIRLTLIVEGAIVRTVRGHAAMSIDKYRFRTAGVRGAAV